MAKSRSTAVSVSDTRFLIGEPAGISLDQMTTASAYPSTDSASSTMAPGGRAAPLQPTSVIGSLALFMTGAFTLIEAVAFWAFQANAGPAGLLLAIGISVALTVLFRDRMRKPGSAAQ